MEVTYHNQFHKAYPDKNSLNLAKQLWLNQLQIFEAKIVFDSVNILMTSSEFLPSLSKLVIHAKNPKQNLMEFLALLKPIRKHVAQETILKTLAGHILLFSISAQKQAGTFFGLIQKRNL